MTAPPLRRPLLLGGLIGLALAAAPSLVGAVEASPGLVRLTPAQTKTLFPEWRRLSLQATQERIAILQKHQQCVNAAGSLEALQACQLQQRQAMLKQQQQHGQALRQMLLRHGLTPPPPTRREGGTRRLSPQPEGIPMI